MNDRDKDQLSNPSGTDIPTPPDKTDSISPTSSIGPPIPRKPIDQTPPPRASVDSSKKTTSPTVQREPNARQSMKQPEPQVIPTPPNLPKFPPPTAERDSTDILKKSDIVRQSESDPLTPPKVSCQPEIDKNLPPKQSASVVELQPIDDVPHPPSPPTSENIDQSVTITDETKEDLTSLLAPQSGPRGKGAVSSATQQTQSTVEKTSSRSGDAPVNARKNPDVYMGDHFVWNPPNSTVLVRTHIRVLQQVYDEALAGIQGVDAFEIGGMFFGTHSHNQDTGQYEVTIDIAVPVECDNATATEFTFTGPAIRETKEKLRLTNEKHGRHYSIVGYYHSHPDHDIFLSSHDQNTFHGNFSGPYCVAMVIQPRRKTAGYFPLEEYENHSNYKRSKRVFHLVDPGKPIGYTHGKPTDATSVGPRYTSAKPQEDAPAFSVGPRPTISRDALKRNEAHKPWWLEFMTDWRKMVPASALLIMVLLAALLSLFGGGETRQPRIALDVFPIALEKKVIVIWSKLPPDLTEEDFVSAKISFIRPPNQTPVHTIEIADFQELQAKEIKREVAASLFHASEIETIIEIKLKKQKLIGENFSNFRKTRKEKNFSLVAKDNLLRWSLNGLTEEQRENIEAGKIKTSMNGSAPCEYPLTKERLTTNESLPLTTICKGKSLDKYSVRSVELNIELRDDTGTYFRDSYVMPTPPPPPKKKDDIEVWS
jgi:proteasome lid subunit RPN8/RPN11